jgi:sulfite exporter TauE/SafE
MDFWLQAFLTGISTGIFCTTQCVPFILPVMMTEKSNLRKGISTLLQFMAGRLVGYLIFGAVFGYLGEKLNSRGFGIISDIGLIVLSAIMILYVLGYWKQRSFWCGMHSQKVVFPFWVGLFTGINLCPPFLLSLDYVFKLHNYVGGIVYFFLFFMGTNLYFIPLLFFVRFSRRAVFQQYAKIAAFLVGMIYLLYGLFDLSRTLFF